METGLAYHEAYQVFETPAGLTKYSKSVIYTTHALELLERASDILSKLLHLADWTQAAIYALQNRLVSLNEALDKEK